MAGEGRLFRPGVGRLHAGFTSAWAEEAIYPGDLVTISVTPPTDQGATAGTLESKSIATDDFMYVTLCDTSDAGTPGLQLGASVGYGIHAVNSWSTVTGDVCAADELIAIQNYGVHPNIQVNDATVTIGDYVAPTTNGGEGGCTNTISASGHGDLGIALTVDAKYTRATADDQDGCVVWLYRL